MKRVLVALLAISMAAGALTGCGSKGSEKTFTVGFDAEFPPYGYRDDSGEYVGFDLDLAAEVCKRQGWELVKQPIDWDAKDMELSSGAIDCIWNGFTMNGREDAYTWTEPYIDNSQVFVVASASGVQNKEELAGKVVAVQKDSSALAALNDEENADNIALRDSFSQLIHDLFDFDTDESELPVDEVKLRMTVKNVVEDILKNGDVMFNMMDIRNYDEYIYYHSVNVGVLSIMVGARGGKLFR